MEVSGQFHPPATFTRVESILEQVGPGAGLDASEYRTCPSKASRPAVKNTQAVKHTQHPSQMVLRDVSPAVKQLGCENNHSSLYHAGPAMSGATPTSPHTFTARKGTNKADPSPPPNAMVKGYCFYLDTYLGQGVNLLMRSSTASVMPRIMSTLPSPFHSVVIP